MYHHRGQTAGEEGGGGGPGVVKLLVRFSKNHS